MRELESGRLIPEPMPVTTALYGEKGLPKIQSARPRSDAHYCLGTGPRANQSFLPLSRPAPTEKGKLASRRAQRWARSVGGASPVATSCDGQEGGRGQVDVSGDPGLKVGLSFPSAMQTEQVRGLPRRGTGGTPPLP